MALRKPEKRGGEPVIQPLRDKKTGEVLTNAKIIRNMDKVLTALKKSSDPKDQVLFSNMINNDMTIYDYIHETAAIEDDFRLQERLNSSLIPNPSLAAKLQAMESGKIQAKK